MLFFISYHSNSLLMYLLIFSSCENSFSFRWSVGPSVFPSPNCIFEPQVAQAMCLWQKEKYMKFQKFCSLNLPLESFIAFWSHYDMQKVRYFRCMGFLWCFNQVSLTTCCTWAVTWPLDASAVERAGVWVKPSFHYGVFVVDFLEKCTICLVKGYLTTFISKS